MKQKIEISKITKTPMCAYNDIRAMIFNGLSNRQIIDTLRQDYAFDQNEIAKAIKEMKFILEGYKLGLLGSQNKFKKKEPIKVIHQTTTSHKVENSEGENKGWRTAQLLI